MRTENLTIVFVDIAGFTATTNRQSRQQNAHLLERFTRLLKPSIRQFSGHLVKSLGDALLLTFHSPTNAMLCARQLHDRLALHQQQHPDQEPIVIRVAAHLGEVRLARHDVFGEAVNLASRIETVTPAGEIYLSEAVFLAMNKAEVPVESAGHFALDGFAHQLHLYRVQKAHGATLPFASNFSANRPAKTWWWLLPLASVWIAMGVWWQWPTPSAPPAIPTLAPHDVRWLYLQWSAASSQISPMLQYDIQTGLERHLVPVQDLFISDAPQQTQMTLRFGLRQLATHNAAELTVELLDTQGHVLQRHTQRWSEQQPQAAVAELQRTVASWFGVRIDQTNDQAPTQSLYVQYAYAQWQLQQAQQQQHRPLLQQALQSLLQIVDAAPQFRRAKLAACDAQLLSAEWSGNQPLTDTQAAVCAISPSDSESNLLQARLAMLQHRSDDAQRLLQQVLQQNSKSMAAYRWLAQWYLANQQPLDAELVLRQAINFQPKYWPALQQLAMFYLEQGQLAEAIDYFRQVVELTPHNADTLTNLGSAYLLQGNLQAAADIYQQALQIAPIAMVQTNLATVYYYLGRYRQAIELYKAAVLAEPDNAEMHGNLADSYRQLGMLDDALLHYQKAVELLQASQPRARSLAFLAKFLYFSGVTTRANELYPQAIQQNNASADIYIVAATLQTQQQQPDAAMQSLQAAIKLGYPANLIVADPDFQPLTTRSDFRQFLQTPRDL